MKNTKLLAVAGLLIAGFILAGSVTAWGGKGANAHSFFVSDDVRTELDQAIAANDYDAFTTIQAENFPNAPTMSEEQFAKIVEQHQFHDQVQAAIANGNYEEWKTLMAQHTDPRSEQLLAKVTADNFHLLKELSDAQEKIRSIHDELGIVPDGPMGMHGMKIMKAGARPSTANAQPFMMPLE